MQRREYGLLQANFFQNMLRELGNEITSDTLILDFGCGEGWTVYQLRKKGFKAFGVDVVNDYASAQKLCRDEGLCKRDEEIYRSIEANREYKIPFSDDLFDCVISDQVFEHVQNYPQAVAEINRVLKPGGCGLQVIPSRYHPIEGHVFVPLATILRGRTYLAFWALLGIRNSFQKKLKWREVANLNYEYLRNCTTYYTKARIRRLFAVQFAQVSFVEAVFIRHHHGRVHRYLHPLVERFPIIAGLFSTVHSRVLFCRKQESSPASQQVSMEKVFERSDQKGPSMPMGRPGR